MKEGEIKLLAHGKWKVKSRFSFYNERNLKDTNEAGTVEDLGEKEMAKGTQPKETKREFPNSGGNKSLKQVEDGCT